MDERSTQRGGASPPAPRLGVVSLGSVSRRAPAESLRRGVELVPGYRLSEKIGDGPHGEVWKADGPGGFPAALKVFRAADDPDCPPDAPCPAWMRRVRHPNLRPIFGAWKVAGRTVLGMEWAEQTLRDRLDEARAQGRRGLTDAELDDFMDEAARGVDALREPDDGPGQGEPRVHLHLGLKPENLVLVGGSLKVADPGMFEFDAARGRDPGATAIAAPEVLAGTPSPWSDQYALAATYLALRGDGPDLGALPDAERPVFARALAMPPESRWPDCRAFVAALREARTATLPAAPTVRTGAGRWGRIARIAAVTLAATSTAWLARPLASTPSAEVPDGAGSSRRSSVPARAPRSAPTPPGATPRRLAPPAIPAVVATPNAPDNPGMRARPTVASSPHPPRPIAVVPVPSPILAGLAVEVHERSAAGPKAGSTAASASPPAAPGSATIVVLMPSEGWNLSVRGAVGAGKPEEWFGARRVIHTPPLDKATEYTIAAFWAGPKSSRFTRSHRLAVSPGETYEVDLRRVAPSSKKVLR